MANVQVKQVFVAKNDDTSPVAGYMALTLKGVWVGVLVSRGPTMVTTVGAVDGEGNPILGRGGKQKEIKTYETSTRTMTWNFQASPPEKMGDDNVATARETMACTEAYNRQFFPLPVSEEEKKKEQAEAEKMTKAEKKGALKTFMALLVGKKEGSSSYNQIIKLAKESGISEAELKSGEIEEEGEPAGSAS